MEPGSEGSKDDAKRIAAIAERKELLDSLPQAERYTASTIMQVSYTDENGRDMVVLMGRARGTGSVDKEVGEPIFPYTPIAGGGTTEAGKVIKVLNSLPPGKAEEKYSKDASTVDGGSFHNGYYAEGMPDDADENSTFDADIRITTGEMDDNAVLAQLEIDLETDFEGTMKHELDEELMDENGVTGKDYLRVGEKVRAKITEELPESWDHAPEEFTKTVRKGLDSDEPIVSYPVDFIRPSGRVLSKEGEKTPSHATITKKNVVISGDIAKGMVESGHMAVVSGEGEIDVNTPFIAVPKDKLQGMLDSAENTSEDRVIKGATVCNGKARLAIGVHAAL